MRSLAKVSPKFVVVISVVLALGALGAGCASELAGPERKPVALTRTDIASRLGETVLLDGSGSYDPDGDGGEDLEYSWSLSVVPAGSASQIGNGTGNPAAFKPDRPGIYVVRLLVRSGLRVSGAVFARLVVSDPDGDGGLMPPEPLPTQPSLPVQPMQPVEPPQPVQPSGGCDSDAACDDGLSCTRDLCSPTHVCEHPPVADGTACADLNGCTIDDACRRGTCVGRDVCKVAPLARYWIRRPQDGTPLDVFADDTANALHLPISYANGSPSILTGSGGGHARFAPPQDADEADEGTDTGAGRLPITGTKLDALHGGRRATLEVRFVMEGCTGSDQAVLGLGNGNDWTSGWLTIRELNRQPHFFIKQKGGTEAAAFALPIPCPMARPAVLHCVVDTTQVVESERVRAYLDGKRLLLTQVRGAALQHNVEIDLGAKDRLIYLGGPHSDIRTGHSRIWFAAVYDEPLHEAAIALHALLLNLDDDR